MKPSTFNNFFIIIVLSILIVLSGFLVVDFKRVNVKPAVNEPVNQEILVRCYGYNNDFVCYKLYSPELNKFLFSKDKAKWTTDRSKFIWVKEEKWKMQKLK